MSFLTTKNPFSKSDPGSTDSLDQPDQERHSENQGLPNGQWIPPVDVLESRAAYWFKADLPGLKASDVRVVRIKETLLISGERNLGSRLGILRQERPRGYFLRRLPLPDDASRQQITAKLSQGVLEVTARKLSDNYESDYPETLEIGIGE